MPLAKVSSKYLQSTWRSPWGVYRKEKWVFLLFHQHKQLPKVVLPSLTSTAGFWSRMTGPEAPEGLCGSGGSGCISTLQL